MLKASQLRETGMEGTHAGALDSGEVARAACVPCVPGYRQPQSPHLYNDIRGVSQRREMGSRCPIVAR